MIKTDELPGLTLDETNDDRKIITIEVPKDMSDEDIEAFMKKALKYWKIRDKH